MESVHLSLMFSEIVVKFKVPKRCLNIKLHEGNSLLLHQSIFIIQLYQFSLLAIKIFNLLEILLVQIEF
jgi:hypothetical protein